MTGELSSLARTATSAVPIETDPWRILAVAESDGNTGIESKEGTAFQNPPLNGG